MHKISLSMFFLASVCNICMLMLLRSFVKWFSLLYLSVEKCDPSGEVNIENGYF